jgi:hypothetical protein
MLGGRRRPTLMLLAIILVVGAIPVAGAGGKSSSSSAMGGRVKLGNYLVTDWVRCAESIAQAPANRNRRSNLVLAPKAPIQVLLCRYFGPSFKHPSKGGALARERLLQHRSLAVDLARKFDDLKPLPNSPIYCPPENGTALYALFRYADEADVPVEVSLTGCREAKNGRTTHAFYVSPSLLRRLRELTEPAG